MIKCVVLDFDGVLVDSNAVKRSAYFDIFAPLGVTRPVMEAVLGDNRDGDRYQIIERILRRLVTAGFLSVCDGVDELVAKYAEQYNDICEEHAATCREIAGASECLPRLVRHYALYVNSATPEEPLRRIIQRRGWEGYFRGVLGRPRAKVENLRWILEHEKIGGDKVVFVGDNQQDLDAALEYGCQFVGMVHNTSQFESEPSHIVRDLLELEITIDRMNLR